MVAGAVDRTVVVGRRPQAAHLFVGLGDSGKRNPLNARQSEPSAAWRRRQDLRQLIRNASAAAAQQEKGWNKEHHAQEGAHLVAGAHNGGNSAGVPSQSIARFD